MPRRVPRRRLLAVAAIALTACGDRVTPPAWTAPTSGGRGGVLTPIAIVAPDTIDVGHPVRIGARFAPDAPPCRFLAVTGWTHGAGMVVAWTGSATPTRTCDPPTLEWPAATAWRTADLPPGLGRALLVACTADEAALTKRIVVRLPPDAAHPWPDEPMPTDVVDGIEERLRRQNCRE